MGNRLTPSSRGPSVHREPDAVAEARSSEIAARWPTLQPRPERGGQPVSHVAALAHASTDRTYHCARRARGVGDEREVGFELTDGRRRDQSQRAPRRCLRRALQARWLVNHPQSPSRSALEA